MYEDEPTDASVVSGAWDMLSSAAEASVDMATAGAYASGAATEAALAAVGHVDAGILDAVGADELAAGIREEANITQEDAGSDWDRAGNALADAGEDVFGQ